MKGSDQSFIIVIPCYDNVDLMDIAAAREVFSFMQDSGFQRPVEIYCACNKETFITRDNLKLTRDESFQSQKISKPDLIWVPGGDPNALGDMLAKPNAEFFRYIKKAAPSAKWITSVCEGAILLASTGLLDGHEITTHWAFYPCMAAFPKVKVVPPQVSKRPDGSTAYEYVRYVKSGNRVTGGGISSGLDEALYLVQLIAGTSVAEKLQRTIQYFPKPPVDGYISGINIFCPVPDLAP